MTYVQMELEKTYNLRIEDEISGSFAGASSLPELNYSILRSMYSNAIEPRNNNMIIVIIYFKYSIIKVKKKGFSNETNFSYKPTAPMEAKAPEMIKPPVNNNAIWLSDFENLKFNCLKNNANNKNIEK